MSEWSIPRQQDSWLERMAQDAASERATERFIHVVYPKVGSLAFKGVETAESIMAARQEMVAEEIPLAEAI